MNNIATTMEGGAAKGSEVTVMSSWARAFLGQLLCRYPCYKVLHKFVAYFDRLSKLAGGEETEPPQIKLLRRIAMRKVGDEGTYSVPAAALSFKDFAPPLLRLRRN